MRIMIAIESLKDQKYMVNYHYALQGFIYSLLKDSIYARVHDKQGYKFFCFSNIYPIGDMCRGDTRYLLISSPNKGIINHIYNALKQLDEEIRIGYMKFRLKGCKEFSLNIEHKRSLRLITATPVVVRIPRYKYKEYNIRPKRLYDYIYWKKEYPLSIFLDQLYANILKKYKEYNCNISYVNNNSSNSSNNNGIRRTTADTYVGEVANVGKGERIKEGIRKVEGCEVKIEEDSKLLSLISDLFKKIIFKKQVAIPLNIHEEDTIVIGSVWEFITKDEEENKEDSNKRNDLLRFIIDCGLGERNSLGFGFINIVD